jgi:hypothetical protein
LADLAADQDLLAAADQDLMHKEHGWVILGIGGADMVIGGVGTTVALAGGGVYGMVIHGGGGTKIIGGAGYPAGAPSLVRTCNPTTIFLFL